MCYLNDSLRNTYIRKRTSQRRTLKVLYIASSQVKALSLLPSLLLLAGATAEGPGWRGWYIVAYNKNKSRLDELPNILLITIKVTVDWKLDELPEIYRGRTKRDFLDMMLL